MNKHTLKESLFFALVFSLIINVPEICYYIYFNGASFKIFSDWDEPYYFQVMKQMGDIPWTELFYLKNWQIAAYSNLDSPLPHNAIDVVIGNIYKLNLFEISSLSLFLDLVCVFFSFMFFSIFYSSYSNHKYGSEIGAAVTLSLPWIPRLLNYCPISLPLPDWLNSTLDFYYVTVPAKRAIYTQVSYPFFALGLVLIQKVSKSNNSIHAIIAGIVSGLIIYIYIFGWVTIFAYSILFISIPFFTSKLSQNEKIQTLKILFFYSLSFLLISCPGLSAVFRNGVLKGAADNILSFINFRSEWFLSPLLLGLITLGILFQLKPNKDSDSNNFKLLNWVILSLFLLFPLINLQPILNKWITPYHFPVFYLYPVASGCIVLMIYNCLLKKVMRYFLVIFILFLIPITLFAQTAKDLIYADPKHDDFISLVKFVRSNLPLDANLMINPYLQPFVNLDILSSTRILPYWMGVLGNRTVIPSVVSQDENRDEIVKNELITGFFLTGEMKLIGSCPNEYNKNLFFSYKDMLTGAWMVTSRIRSYECQIGLKLIKNQNICDIMNNDLNIYILWEFEFNLPKPELYSLIGHPVWESPNKFYELIKIDFNDFSRSYCLTSS
jgi:hypothetical protein